MMGPPRALRVGGCLLPTAAGVVLLPPSSSSSVERLRRRSTRSFFIKASAAASSSSYNGWGELPPDFSFPLLLLQWEGKKKNLLVLLLLVPAFLSRLPPLPLLAAAFTAGFAARHLCSSPQLTLALAGLDAQVRALRDHLTSHSQPILDSQPILNDVDRLRDAVLHASRLAHHDTSIPVLGDLADSMAAWARGTMRDLTSSTRSNKDLHSSSPILKDDDGDKPVPIPRSQDMLPFHNEEEEEEDTTGTSNNPELERLLLKHRRPTGSLLEKRTLDIRDTSYIDHQDDHHPFAADSDPQEFGRNLKEAAHIMNKARECMLAGADEETADTLLYKSARLLSTAVALRPTSLVAVGQLGNAYLLHGELKLKISRELRTLLATTLSNARSRKPMLSRDNVSAALVHVCEECESLLLEAGRSYRTALSIDSGDVKALYNWGLALIFRAQLLADIGPEAAVDADRVYLAAIDKFDTMLSKSNTYAPEALYRWGTVLQQRSHLCPRNSRERVRLLEQAKSLFEDVLYVEADNKMVREALSSCISELNYHGRWI